MVPDFFEVTRFVFLVLCSCFWPWYQCKLFPTHQLSWKTWCVRLFNHRSNLHVAACECRPRGFNIFLLTIKIDSSECQCYVHSELGPWKVGNEICHYLLYRVVELYKQELLFEWADTCNQQETCPREKSEQRILIYEVS